MLFRWFVVMVAVSFSPFTLAQQLLLEIVDYAGQDKGQVVIELYPELAPKHVARIERLAKEGLYNGVAFHRVIDGFMAQTGDVMFGKMPDFDQKRAGTGGSSYPDLPAEFSRQPFAVGVVGMARSRLINSANSQFFIVTHAATHLNGQYTVIGKVTSGMDVVHNIKQGSRYDNGAVSKPDWIKTATILSQEE